MTGSIGVETMAMPVAALGGMPHAPAQRQAALKTPSEAPQPAARVPQDRVDLSSDAVPFHLTMRATAPRSASAVAAELSPEEQAFLLDLKARDREVRAHEQAHASVGGIYAGAPQYDYVTGPDGQRYAVGGEVKIDVAPIPDDPEGTIEKMIVVREAALAPREPSAQDRRVAETADQHRRTAEVDLRELKTAALNGDVADGAAVSPQSADGSLAARLFADVAATYRQATDFFGIGTEPGETAVFA